MYRLKDCFVVLLKKVDFCSICRILFYKFINFEWVFDFEDGNDRKSIFFIGKFVSVMVLEFLLFDDFLDIVVGNDYELFVSFLESKGVEVSL